MEKKKIKFNDMTFAIQPWKMSECLSREKALVPLMIGPLMNGMTYAEHSEEEIMGAVLFGLADGITQVDLVEIVESLGPSVTYVNKDGLVKSFTFENIDADDIDIGTVHLVVAAVIKVNYGPALKKDFKTSLSALMEL